MWSYSAFDKPMTMHQKIIILLFLPVSIFAQGVRIDSQATTINGAPPGAMAQVLVVPGASVAVCQDALCMTAATTYTDITLGTACPANAQITLPGSTGCVATTDAQGRFGFWIGSATAYYEVTLPNGTVYGPYAVTPGGGSSAPYAFSGSTAGALVTITQGGAGGALAVSGSTALIGTLSVSGASSLAGLTLSGGLTGTTASLTSTLSVTGIISGGSTIAMTGGGTFGGNVAVTGQLAASAGLFVGSYGLNNGGALTVASVANAGSETIAGNLSVTGTIAGGAVTNTTVGWGVGANAGQLNYGSNYVSITATTTNTSLNLAANGSGVIALQSNVTGTGSIALAANKGITVDNAAFGLSGTGALTALTGAFTDGMTTGAGSYGLSTSGVLTAASAAFSGGLTVDSTMYGFSAAGAITATTVNGTTGTFTVLSVAPAFNVSTLYNGSGASAIPACASGTKGTDAWVSDGKASPTAFSNYAAADGAAIAKVGCDGITWRYGY